MRGARSSGSARFGIHSSPYSSTRSSTFSPRPPTRTGGCGFWTGFGHDQIGSKSTCSPWNSASSCVQISFMASTRSRMIEKRRRGSVPWLRISSRFQPPPTPNSNAAAGDEVERGDLLGRDDRVALDDQADAGTDPQPLGRLRDGGKRHERVERVPVLLRQAAAAWVRRVAADRDVGVLGEQQRLEAGVLRGAAKLRGRDREVRREGHETESHAATGSIARRRGVTIRCRRSKACAKA